jgi:hypothetical protein
MLLARRSELKRAGSFSVFVDSSFSLLHLPPPHHPRAIRCVLFTRVLVFFLADVHMKSLAELKTKGKKKKLFAREPFASIRISVSRCMKH